MFSRSSTDIKSVVPGFRVRSSLAVIPISVQLAVF